MKPKYYWIKERHNPQFKKPYYVPCGNISIAKAREMEGSVYGGNYMSRFDSKEEYDARIEQLKTDGEDVRLEL